MAIAGMGVSRGTAWSKCSKRWLPGGVGIVWAAAVSVLGWTATGEELVVASWNIQWLSKEGAKHRKVEHYARLRAIAESIDADLIALQEVDAGFVERVFDPESYDLALSSRSHRQKTGFAIRKGRKFRYERRPDVNTLDYSGEGHGRYGTQIELVVAGRTVDVMSVHLKAFCFDNVDDEDNSKSDDCGKLNRQIPPLEEWIDERLGKGRTVVVLGDFNRRFAKQDDRVWSDLADGEPMAIVSAAGGKKPRCWGGKYKEFIDHIILGGEGVRLLAFKEIVFDEAAAESKMKKWGKRLSNHCPIRAVLHVEPEVARSDGGVVRVNRLGVDS